MAETQILRLRCACGWEATGTEDELNVAAVEHGRRVHNMTPTRDEVRAMILPPADHRAQPTDAGDRSTRP
jgi:predicted small metal-binding protein